MQQGPFDPPEPPGVKPVSMRGFFWWIGVTAVGMILIVAAFFVPIPAFYALLPGPVEDVEKLVDIDKARSYSSEGSLYLTTVSVDPSVTFSEFVASWFDPDREIVDRSSFTAGQSSNQFRREQERQMEASKQNARQVALSALGFGRPHGDGARVVATLEDSPAEGVLQRGDVILSVDGEPVETTCDVGRVVDDRDVGDQVDVRIRRDGEPKELTLETIENPLDPGSPIVGISMVDVNYEFEPGVDVTIRTGDIGGPSAGLMFALAVYDRLTPGDLTGGRKIAGTGTIECDGGVGPIGSVDLKVAGAEAKGAEIFFAPAADVGKAEEVGSENIKVIAISNFDEAVEYLEGLD